MACLTSAVAVQNLGLLSEHRARVVTECSLNELQAWTIATERAFLQGFPRHREAFTYHNHLVDQAEQL